ncbi:nucleotide-binding universal stress UspA family protein [Catenulispora sp. MAP12-49]|uniref:universal stress protein n=1 Tax=Catenulispora sp. MAP12-49 TaxID=3156302 RepID=UPI003514534D
MSRPVIVGFDDTEHSTYAVTCAVREAVARSATLRLVHAYQWIPPGTFGLPPGIAAEAAVAAASQAMLDKAAERLRTENPGLTVQAVSAGGDPAGALADQGRDASLVVVGGRGRGGFAGQLLGSVALRVLDLATCPVMVARGAESPAAGRIMAGVDVDRPGGDAGVLEFAFAEAALRNAEVFALHVWDDPSPLYLADTRFATEVTDAVQANRVNLLAAAVEPWREKYPNVHVSCQALPGTPGRVLVDSTRLVDTLVIGGLARTGEHRGMRVGALAHTVLHHAHCPVIIVPEGSGPKVPLPAPPFASVRGLSRGRR